MTDYEYYKSLGICPYCRQRQARPGKVACSNCAKIESEYQKMNPELGRKRSLGFYQRQREKGLCGKCGKPSGGASLCRECAIIHNAMRWITNRRKKNGTWTGKVFDEATIRLICLNILYRWGMLDD